MQDKYGVRDANCQTMVNLLVQRIAEGSTPYRPYRTLSHALGRGPTERKLFAISESDKTKPTKLIGKLTLEPPDWNKLHSKSLPSSPAKDLSANDKIELIDLDRAVRPGGPLEVDELRSSAHAWSRGPTSRAITEYKQPPPASLPPGYIEWMESQRSKAPTTQHGADLFFEAPPPRFPGPTSDYIQYAKDEIAKHFENSIRRQRDSQVRDEAMKPWFDAGVPMVRREAKLKEREKLENNLMRQERVALIEAIKRDKAIPQRDLGGSSDIYEYYDESTGRSVRLAHSPPDCDEDEDQRR